jgi:hypothetical protein
LVIFYLIVALLTLGSSTNGMSTNATIFAVISTVHNITGSVMGWSVVVTIAGLVIAFLTGARGREGTATCAFGCLVVVPVLIMFGTLVSWLMTGGMLVTFSPQTGPLSAIFYVWAIIAFTVGIG